MDFCGPRGISFSPRTMTQNYFYGGGGEIALDGRGELRRLADGRLDFDGATPPMSFERLSISVRHGATFEEAAETVNAMFSELPVLSVDCSVELQAFVTHLPMTCEIEKGDDLYPTDMVEGWVLRDAGYEASVQSRQARIVEGDGLWRLSVSGIPRASARQLNDLFAFAGRCDWTWWQGVRPEREAEAVAALPSP